jgi:hypothetical protein
VRNACYAIFKLRSTSPSVEGTSHGLTEGLVTSLDSPVTPVPSCSNLLALLIALAPPLSLAPSPLRFIALAPTPPASDSDGDEGPTDNEGKLLSVSGNELTPVAKHNFSLPTPLRRTMTAS